MRRAGAAVLAAVAAAVAVGCGDDERAPEAAQPVGPAQAQPVGDVSGGSTAQFADCGDWKAGSRAEREATVRELRGQFTPQRSKSAASPLADERAYEIFENACAPDYSESLRLYKLYVKVQGFAPLSG